MKTGFDSAVNAFSGVMKRELGCQSPTLISKQSMQGGHFAPGFVGDRFVTIDLLFALDPFWCYFESPGKNERDRKTDE
jgi:hypothetical protein